MNREQWIEKNIGRTSSSAPCVTQAVYAGFSASTPFLDPDQVSVAIGGGHDALTCCEWAILEEASPHS